MSGYRIKPAPAVKVGNLRFVARDGLVDIFECKDDNENEERVCLLTSEALALREWLDSVIEEVKS